MLISGEVRMSVIHADAFQQLCSSCQPPGCGSGSTRSRAGCRDRAGNPDRDRQPAVSFSPSISDGTDRNVLGSPGHVAAQNCLQLNTRASVPALRILAGARYRWLCVREDRCRGASKTLRSMWRGAPPVALSTSHGKWAAAPLPGSPAR